MFFLVCLFFIGFHEVLFVFKKYPRFHASVFQIASAYRWCVLSFGYVFAKTVEALLANSLIPSTTK